MRTKGFGHRDQNPLSCARTARDLRISLLRLQEKEAADFPGPARDPVPGPGSFWKCDRGRSSQGRERHEDASWASDGSPGFSLGERVVRGAAVTSRGGSLARS